MGQVIAYSLIILKRSRFCVVVGEQISGSKFGTLIYRDRETEKKNSKSI